MVVIPLVFGVMMIIPIGGADMPTVISLLNSYAGLSAAAMGFVLNSKLLIVAGALDGASGFILSVNMSKAMNRSFTNVLFGAFGQVQARGRAARWRRKPVRSATPEEAAAILAAANKVVIVPGYGMAVAQAQHKVRELYDALTQARRRREVRHPSGRRPHARAHERAAGRGRHPLRQAARHGRDQRRLPADGRGADHRRQRRDQSGGAQPTQSSPIYGMPILDVDKARTVMVIKRSMSPGFAGIDNPLYYLDKTLMLFGDAKQFVNSIVRELSGGGGHG